ncbi:MAG: hypothetical protein DKM50_08160 [Candidatus Margulisiibacteriota bacterium]|nr:MAG: hypothetical protein A2X43_12555 [Candidatus Margulisbacteria bacterium GWD2_39_127]OGI01922.1 MAG: hypothetical protein A2X42_11850 [Candidatus Margulisbacteria bacterium GWF2_38_17]OGI11570.1 MAG: hypothetical protein A2X41_10075 [Candidatus Margulisbacteria bacterium GWE2_39_32]PZM79622.1 MAG: hypothetical protein DKM50_08160 [Candidatus Margulisiibacteriota bacterium]HAR62121.1 hypothetical protein [Candidatus Margulisiibacteriota bacterium]
MLSYEINQDLIRALKELFSLCQRRWDQVDAYPEPKKKYIRKHSLISNIGASTRIENAILTDVEIDWIDKDINTESNATFKDREHVIKDKLSKDKERSIEEVAGYRDAIQIINHAPKDFVPMRESNIKGLHREIMKYYSGAVHYQGNYKTQINSVVESNSRTGSKKTLLRTADPGIETETSMHDLVAWFNATLMTDPWCLPTAVEFVFRFLAIHPFQDGNGRLSRLFFQAILMNSEDNYFSAIIPYIALDREVEKTRPQYYLVLNKCSGGHFNPDPAKYKYNELLAYMIQVIRESLPNIDHYAQKYDLLQTLSETDLKILACFKEQPEHYLQTKNIVEMLNIPRRTAIYSLNKLLAASFVQSIGRGAGVKYKITF